MGVIDISIGIAGWGQTVLFGDSNTEMFWWNEAGACKVVNAGFGGATAAELVQKAPWVAESAKPRLVHIMIGTNDMERGTPLSDFTDDLTRIVQTFKAAKAAVVLWEIPPTAASRPNGDRRTDMSKTIRDIAMKTGADLDSVFSIKLTGADGYALPGTLLPDGVHLSVPSQQLRKDRIDEWSRTTGITCRKK